jgi:hypothetical protein
MMTKRTGFLAVILAALLAAAMPLSAGAQAPGRVGAPSKAATSKGGGGGGRKPAARAAPHRAPQRAVAPHRAPQRAAAPRHKAPTAQRTIQMHQIKRAQSFRQTKPARKAVRQTPQIQQQQKRAQQRQRQKRALPSTAATRQQQHTERVLRRREDREILKLPASQRAKRREEIRRAREQRTQPRLQQTQQPGATVHSNAGVQTTGTVQRNARAQHRALRRHRAGVVTAHAARRGRFAAPFAAQAKYRADWRRVRKYRYAARRAWRRGYRAAFVAWYGPVFWPYVYSDIFDYAFWPYGYEEGYWAYVYDDFIDSLFWGERGPPAEYVEYAAPSRTRPRSAAVEDLCEDPGTGITAWPFREIERKVHLDSEQMRLLDDVRDAAKKAADVFKASCPARYAFPMTPPGRLRAMTARLQATLEAVQRVRPPLEAFYNSLSDEQKERFNELGPSKLRSSVEVTAALPSDSKACAEAKHGLTNLPIEQIDEVVKPTDNQEKALDTLEDATQTAVSILQAACPDETPLTPPGRLEAMGNRLQAMIDAANAVKPALDDFYASLSNEQKARFNRIGRELAEPKS